jgi:hypothetical protein
MNPENSKPYPENPDPNSLDIEKKADEFEEFMKSPNLSDSIKEKVAESSIEGGADITKMKPGDALKIMTKSREYTLQKTDTGFTISGHPEFCPTPTEAVINGSTWGHGGSIKIDFVGRGMCLEYTIAGKLFYTSTIQDIQDVK